LKPLAVRQIPHICFAALDTKLIWVLNEPSLEHARFTIILPERLNSRQGHSFRMPKRMLAPRNRSKHAKTQPTLIFHSGTCRVAILHPPAPKVPVWNVSRSKIAPCGCKVAASGTRRECRSVPTPWNPSRTLNRAPLVKVAILERVAPFTSFVAFYLHPAY